jgi:hypothetical protein
MDSWWPVFDAARYPRTYRPALWYLLLMLGLGGALMLGGLLIGVWHLDGVQAPPLKMLKHVPLPLAPVLLVLGTYLVVDTLKSRLVLHADAIEILDARRPRHARFRSDPARGGLVLVPQPAQRLRQPARMREWLDRGLAVDPGSLVLRRKYLALQRPMFGGSLEAMESFLLETQRRGAPPQVLAALEGLVVMQRGWDRQNQGDEDAALALFRHAATLGLVDEDLGLALRQEARILIGRGQFAQALALLDGSLQADLGQRRSLACAAGRWSGCSARPRPGPRTSRLRSGATRGRSCGWAACTCRAKACRWIVDRRRAGSCRPRRPATRRPSSCCASIRTWRPRRLQSPEWAGIHFIGSKPWTLMGQGGIHRSVRHRWSRSGNYFLVLLTYRLISAAIPSTKNARSPALCRSNQPRTRSRSQQALRRRAPPLLGPPPAGKKQADCIPRQW